MLFSNWVRAIRSEREADGISGRLGLQWVTHRGERKFVAIGVAHPRQCRM
jgi:hypothetical protein